MRKPLCGIGFAVVLAAFFCCPGLSAQEPDEPVAAGSVFEIGKDEVGLEDDFNVKPKVQATYTHPVTEKEGKASAKVVNKIGPQDPADTADCEWSKRIPLYDKKLLSTANKAGTFTAAWLADDENEDQNQPLALPLSLTSKQVPVDVLERVIHLYPPLIYDVVVEDGVITITGRWFGVGKPKVWMEYLNANDQVKRLMCKIGAPDGEDGRVNAKGKPVYMNPADGASKVVVQVPKLPKGVASLDALSHVVVDSGSGLAADTELYAVTFDPTEKGTRVGGGELLQALKHGQAAVVPIVIGNFGWVFGGWDKAFDRIVEPTVVTALYDVATYTLTYTAGPNGTVNGAAQVTQTVSHGNDGTVVTAIPDAHHHFISWSDGTLTAARQDTGVTADLAVTANFAIDTYAVTFTTDGTPGATVAGGVLLTETVPHGGSSTAVLAEAPAGHVFVGWTGDHGGFDNPLSVGPVTAEMAVTANFAPADESAYLTMGISGNGTVDPAGMFPVRIGQPVAITATPSLGSRFIRWSVLGSGTVADAYAAATTIVLAGDASAVATFATEAGSAVLTILAGPDGSASPAGSISVFKGQAQAILATPDEGHHFTAWAGTVGAAIANTAAASTTVSLSQDATVTAAFAANPHTVTFHLTDKGTRIGGGALVQQVADGGAAAAPEVDPADGWTLSGWSMAFGQVTAPMDITAVYHQEAADLYVVVNLVTGAITEFASAPTDLLTNPAYKETKMVFRRITAGTFIMGSPEDELGRTAEREIQHQVTLTQDFHMAVFEVTQAQYQLVMGTNPSTYLGAYRPVETVSWNTVRGGDWPNGDPGADTFMDKLRTLTGDALPFDLPTDAQWEYACRAGTTTALNSGKNLTAVEECPNMAEVGRYGYNNGDLGGVQDGYGGYLTRHTAAANYVPNTWGLYDMHGNVWEWCLDWHEDDLGVDPVSDPIGGDTGTYRALRGGSWDYNAGLCRSAFRGTHTPPYSSSAGGFRVSFSSTHLVVDLASGDVLHLSRVPADLLTNADYKTTKMVFRRIPAGTFTMGSPTDELGRFADSEFQHQVTLTKDFYIGVFEVTQAQYKAVMSGADPSAYKGDHRPVEMVSWNTVRGGDWPNGDPGTDTFMDKLRTLTGDALPFDLPTEAQWEYACRAGTSRAYNDYTQNGGTGSDCLTTGEGQDTNLDPLAWYRYNAAWQFLEHQEVGTKQANTWGLYDMHGNVYEWCLDWYVADLGVDLVVDPVGGDTGSARVGRSGSWNGDAKGCRSANRNYGPPSTSATTLGFRAALAPR